MYKVVREFEFDGKVLKMGEEIFLSERDASKHLNHGEIVHGRELNPDDESDAKIIKQAEEEHDARYETGMEKEAAREEKKQEELKEDDGKRAELVAEGKQLLEDIAEVEGEEADRDEVSQLERIETPELEKRVAELREKKAELDEEEDEDEEEKPEKPAKGGKGK